MKTSLATMSSFFWSSPCKRGTLSHLSQLSREKQVPGRAEAWHRACDAWSSRLLGRIGHLYVACASKTKQVREARLHNAATVSVTHRWLVSRMVVMHQAGDRLTSPQCKMMPTGMQM